MSKFAFNKPAAPAPEAKEETAVVTTPETTNEVVNTATEGDTFKAKAVELASRESEEMSSAITVVMKAKEDWQGGPVRVLLAMQETYGEELASFPEPDSEGGNNPDKFKIAVTGNDGKTTMKQTSFYAEFADATKEGKAICDELAFIKRANNPEMAQDGIPQAIKDMNPQERVTRENFLKGRRATIRASYKKAMALGFQLVAVNGLPGMVAEIVMTDSGEVENTTKPILVYEEVVKGPVKKWEHFSIGSFCKLDVGKAKEKGGNLTALKGTVARNTNGGATGNNGKATDVPAIATVETFVERFVDVFRFMDQMQLDKSQKDIGKLYKVLKEKDNDELIVAFVEFEQYLGDIDKELGLSKKYTAIQAKSPELVTDAKAVKTEKAAQKAS